MNSSISLQELKKLATFIKSNQDLLLKIKGYFFQDYYQSAKSILKKAEEVPEQEYKTFVKQDFLAFLEHVIADQAAKEVKKFFSSWSVNKPMDPSDIEKRIHDITRLYSLRKKIVLKFLPYYTNQVSTATHIALELEQFHGHLTASILKCHHAFLQQELFQENELVSSVIDNTVNGVLVLDTRLRIWEVNAVMCDIYNLEKENILGKPLYEAFPHYKKTSIGQAVTAVLDGTMVFISERPFEKKDGFYEANLNPLYDQDGKVKGCVFIVHETTHRKKTEDSLKEAYLQLKQQQEELQDLHFFQQQVMASVPSLIFLYDLQKNAFAYTNEKIFKLIGYTPDEVKRMDRDLFENVLLPQEPGAEGLQSKLCNHKGYQNLNSHEFLDAELRVKHKNGSLRWLRTKSKVFRRDKNDNPSLILGIAEDITEKKEAQDQLIHAQDQLIKANAQLEKRVAERTAKLAASEKHLRTLTDALPVQIAYMDRDQHVRFINKAVEKFLHIRKEKVLGKKLKEIVGEERYLKIRLAIEKASTGEALHFEYQEDSPTSETVYFNIDLIPHIDKGAVVGFYWLTYDISERKEAEQTTQKLYQEVRQKNKRLKRINIALDNFIYTASHDLRSPVLNIQGLIQLLGEAKDTENYQAEKLYIDKMEEAAAKLGKTIDDLIQITRIQQEAEPKVVEKNDLPHIVNEVKEDLEKLIIETKAKITEDYQVKEIQYARSHLRSILYNLLSNALKYRDPAKQLIINIKTTVKQQSVVLKVSDNGLGMSSNQQKQLFNVFKRMHDHVDGTGMGLFSVKRIVENNGGKIKVSSSPGEGSKFQVYL
jgi:PAS domain S-box-containing protein